jgi:hypothetical protein
VRLFSPLHRWRIKRKSGPITRKNQSSSSNGMLKFSYQSSSESLAVDFVRVCKSDGRVVVTPPESFQDMPADVRRAAPFYSCKVGDHLMV